MVVVLGKVGLRFHQSFKWPKQDKWCLVHTSHSFNSYFCPFLTLSFSFKTSNLACVLIYFHSPSLHYMFRLFSHASLSRSLSNLFNPRIFQPCPFYDHFRFNLVPYIPQDFSWSLSRVCVHIILYLFLTIINLITCH